MKSLNKIYRGLSPRAAAFVAWSMSARGSPEVERLVANVSHEYRVAPALEFGQTIVWLDALTRCWAIIHWRLMYEHANARAALALSSDAVDDDSALVSKLRGLRSAESRLLACDKALDDAAKGFGFDGDTVREMSTAIRFEAVVPGAESDPEYSLEIRNAITCAHRGGIAKH